ncbi:MAG TPA: TrkA family potassium uptake protein [Coriobacteriia bacterium]
MKVIIAGCGRVGALLATKFSAEGHDVAVIDKDPAAFKRLGKAFKGITVKGLVFDRDVLTKAGADMADAFVAVTSGDNSNVVSSTIARDIYRIPKVVARIFDPRRADIYRRLGIPTISSVSWAVNEIMSIVMHQALVRDTTLGDGEVQLVKLSVTQQLIGRRVEDISMPNEVLVVAIIRAGQSFIPATGATFREGDVLELAVLTTAMPKFKRMIGL